MRYAYQTLNSQLQAATSEPPQTTQRLQDCRCSVFIRFGFRGLGCRVWSVRARNLPFGIGSAQTCRSICWVVPCLGSSHSTVVSSGFLYPNFSHYPRERAVGIFLFKGEYTTIDLNSVLQVGGLKYHKDFVFAVASADTACRFGQGIAQFIRLADLLPALQPCSACHDLQATLPQERSVRWRPCYSSKRPCACISLRVAPGSFWHQRPFRFWKVKAYHADEAFGAWDSFKLPTKGIFPSSFQLGLTSRSCLSYYSYGGK